MTARALVIAPDPPTPGAPEKQAVRSMFDRIAPRYDLLNRLLSAGVDRRWRRQAVSFLSASPSARLLDLCAGTADLLIEALQGAPARRGIGVDLSFEMLARGAAKLRTQRLADRAALASGDAERLPLRSAAFDGALVAFGIRNVGARADALKEMLRVLRPGAPLVVLEFQTPPGLLGTLYRGYFEQVLPRVGAAISGDGSAYSYLPASVARFPKPEAFADAMRGAGFTAVSYRPLTLGIAYLHRGERPA